MLSRDAFPERFHHPKEDAYLFRLLALRYPDAAPLIDQVKTEHRAGPEKIRALEQTLERYQHGGAAEFQAFAEAVQTYAAFHWDHMRTEEDKLIPLAPEHETAALPAIGGTARHRQPRKIENCTSCKGSRARKTRRDGRCRADVPA